MNHPRRCQLIIDYLKIIDDPIEIDYITSNRRICALTISTDVRARLRGEILGGGIAPGGKINVDRVKSLYGVSLSPLREALSQLVAEGLVEADENQGFRAASVSKEKLSRRYSGYGACLRRQHYDGLSNLETMLGRRKLSRRYIA